jgi:hypothetical protein
VRSHIVQSCDVLQVYVSGKVKQIVVERSALGQWINLWVYITRICDNLKVYIMAVQLNLYVYYL